MVTYNFARHHTRKCMRRLLRCYRNLLLGRWDKFLNNRSRYTRYVAVGHYVSDCNHCGLKDWSQRNYFHRSRNFVYRRAWSEPLRTVEATAGRNSAESERSTAKISKAVARGSG